MARFEHPWLLYLLPVAGGCVGLMYHWVGKSAEGGNNLIMDEIHQPGGGVPRRMAPLILVSTIITHLSGGSAGREGTAVQMGGSLAGAFGRWFRLGPEQVRLLLMAGIAAGFGAVFGTPLAGAVFAIEVLAIGQMRNESLMVCLVAALAGDWTCHAWGIGHTSYTVSYMSGAMVPAHGFHLHFGLLVKALAAGAVFGLVAAFFAAASHRCAAFFRRICPVAPLRPVLGGCAVIALVHLLGTREYLGLGVSSPNAEDVTLVSLFTLQEAHPWAWWWKLVFTVVTLGAGFKGGEVTPLFFIGAALGHALAGVMGVPPDLWVALGFVGVFAGATNTPLACTLMGIELFGAANSVYLAAACFMAYACSGHSGIYPAQRVVVPKHRWAKISAGTALRDLHGQKKAASEAKPAGKEARQD